jgi:hypothetical protein
MSLTQPPISCRRGEREDLHHDAAIYFGGISVRNAATVLDLAPEVAVGGVSLFGGTQVTPFVSVARENLARIGAQCRITKAAEPS